MLSVHENNLINKIKQNYNGCGKEIEKFYNEIYKPFQKSLNDLKFNIKNSKTFDKATTLIDKYLGEIDNFSTKYNIKSQSKFRSTVIEEISMYLFKDLSEIKSGIFGIFNKNVFAGMKINSKMHVDIIPKDVDFCIGKKVNLVVDETQKLDVIIPVVCVEVKTYLDATMFGEVQNSSKQIKNASPNAKTFVLMEYNDVAKEKIIAARYDNILNEMFVLRGGSRKDVFFSPMSTKVLMDYYFEVVKAIEDTKLDDKVIVPGKLIRPL